MSFIRRYELVARSGCERQILEALTEFAGYLSAVKGFVSAEVARSRAEAGVYFFDERWISAAAHAESGTAFPKEKLKILLGLLQKPPRHFDLDVA